MSKKYYSSSSGGETSSVYLSDSDERLWPKERNGSFVGTERNFGKPDGKRGGKSGGEKKGGKRARFLARALAIGGLAAYLAVAIANFANAAPAITIEVDSRTSIPFPAGVVCPISIGSTMAAAECVPPSVQALNITLSSYTQSGSAETCGIVTGVPHAAFVSHGTFEPKCIAFNTGLDNSIDGSGGVIKRKVIEARKGDPFPMLFLGTMLFPDSLPEGSTIGAEVAFVDPDALEGYDEASLPDRLRTLADSSSSRVLVPPLSPVILTISRAEYEPLGDSAEREKKAPNASPETGVELSWAISASGVGVVAGKNAVLGAKKRAGKRAASIDRPSDGNGNDGNFPIRHVTLSGAMGKTPTPKVPTNNNNNNRNAVGDASTIPAIRSDRDKEGKNGKTRENWPPEGLTAVPITFGVRVSDFRVEKTSEQSAATIPNLLGEIGGIVGVLVGASLLSLLDWVVDFTVDRANHK